VPGEISWLVITPSIAPRSCVDDDDDDHTDHRDRRRRRKQEERIRDERLLSVKVSWNVLALPAAVVTARRSGRSSTSCETGTGTAGPIINVSAGP